MRAREVARRSPVSAASDAALATPGPDGARRSTRGAGRSANVFSIVDGVTDKVARMASDSASMALCPSRKDVEDVSAPASSVYTTR